MDLREFLKIIKQNIIYIVALATFGAVIGFFSADFFGGGYHHSQLFFLSEPSIKASKDQNYRSESFFLQEKSRNFTDTAVAILSSPDFQNEILNPQDSLSVRKVGPQVIRLTYISQQPESSNTQLAKAAEAFNTKIQGLAQSSTFAQLKPVAPASAPTYSKLYTQVLFVFGAVLGTAFALFIVSLKNYFRL